MTLFVLTTLYGLPVEWSDDEPIMQHLEAPTRQKRDV